jgi:hypothetical protein
LKQKKGQDGLSGILSVINNYYGRNKHRYLQYEDDLFANYIYSLIFDNSFLKYDNAIEIGAGMGRFSAPIVKQFVKTTIVEPVKDYTDVLRQKFAKEQIMIINSSAEDFLSKQLSPPPSVVFCFHLMHHLTYKQRQLIYQFVKRTGSKGVLVEPNPFNPLILLQTLLNPDMSIPEEIQYLRLTPKRYKKEIERNKLSLTSYKRICIFPPFVINSLLNKFSNHFPTPFEVLNYIVPFMGAYQMICFEETD